MMSAGMMTAVLLGTPGALLVSLGAGDLLGLAAAFGLAVAAATTVRGLQGRRATPASAPAPQDLPLAA